MLTQNMAKNRFRVLDESEIEAVSGGSTNPGDNDAIVVVGRLSGFSPNQFTFDGFANSSGFGNFSSLTGFDFSSLLGLPSDSDGDGTPDNEDTAPNDANEGGTIVVTAPVGHGDIAVLNLQTSFAYNTGLFLSIFGITVGGTAATTAIAAEFGTTVATGVVAGSVGVGANNLPSADAIQQDIFNTFYSYYRQNGEFMRFGDY